MEEVYVQYFDNLLKGRREMCRATVEALTAEGYSAINIYEDLFRRSLYQVGEYWEMNKISVATEHMATAITENLMIGLQPQLFCTERVGKKVVIACIANEYHQIGAKMVADIFESKGWDSLFIGASTPAGELLRLLKTQTPDLLGLSLSIYFNIGELKNTLRMVRNEFPRLPVILGGQAFSRGGAEILKNQSKVYLVQNMPHLEEFIQSLNVLPAAGTIPNSTFTS